MKTIHRCACVVLTLLAACSVSRPPEALADTAAILAHMRSTWDRPDAPLDAGPVVVAGDYAIADWTQGRRGGRALLARRGKAWTTQLCAGDAIRTIDGLRAAGVPVREAEALAAKLADAEKAVPRPRLASMSTFAGIMRMAPEVDAHGAHH